MRRYLFCFLLLMTSIAHAQNRKIDFNINNYRNTITYADHKITFQLLSPDLEPKYTSSDRYYYWFSANQIKITQGGFSGKLLHGDYFDYYMDSSLKEQGRFKKGLKDGEWKQWTKEGKLISQITYREGKKEGRFYQYDQDGRLVEEGFFKNNQVSGKHINYTQKDSSVVSHYKNGLIVPVDERGWLKKLFSKRKKAKN